MIFRFLRGPRLIAAVINTFEALIVHIERGIQHTEAQIVGTTTQIEYLESQARELQQHRLRGLTFAANLRNLVG